jgi:hypothetical protein
MYFHPARVFWIGWSLIWAAGWTVLAVFAALSVPRHLCGLILVRAWQCAAANPPSNLGLVIIFTVLALASVAFAFIPARLGKSGSV